MDKIFDWKKEDLQERLEIYHTLEAAALEEVIKFCGMDYSTIAGLLEADRTMPYRVRHNMRRCHRESLEKVLLTLGWTPAEFTLLMDPVWQKLFGTEEYKPMTKARVELKDLPEVVALMAEYGLD